MSLVDPGPRERVFAAITDKMREIHVAAGYATEAGANVFRMDLTREQLGTRVPALLVLDPLGGESYTFMDGKVYRVTTPVMVAGLVSVGAVDLPSAPVPTRLNELINDVMAALLQDPTFGGACQDSVLERTSTFTDVARGEGYFAIQLHATYHIERGVMA